MVFLVGLKGDLPIQGDPNSSEISGLLSTVNEKFEVCSNEANDAENAIGV